MGKRLSEMLCFSDDFKLIEVLTGQVDEFKQILMLENGIPEQDYFDLTPELKRLYIENTFIELKQLFNLKLSLSIIASCLSFFKNRDVTQYPNLIKLSEEVSFNPEILASIEKIINEKGAVKDKASTDLFIIRKELYSKQSSVDRKINQILNTSKKDGWVTKEEQITIRSGRLVIPVSATNKRKVKGFIHDESATGQTVYIEPTEIFDINNEIRELENAEKREIVKILTLFTDYLRPFLGDLITAYHYLGEIDFIRAKAKFAIQVNGIKPVLNKKPHIEWQKAFHPLLHISHKTRGKKVVPYNLRLDSNERILIISGPNAGGKSVCLKTVGLLQYMLQSGLLIPVKDDSEAGIFDKIFIDIGDEQSLENDLSTYSSHLLNMKFFAGNADNNTLILIDEFGTGTEPNLGGAIAESILEQLNNKQAYGVITTHYSNLKLLAGKLPGIVNGAMLFNTKEMLPLYKLSIGKPGSSFAFEIAGKIGLQKEILDNASTKTGKTLLDFEKQLQQLEVEKDEMNKKSRELKVADEFLSEMIDKYEKLTLEIETTQSEIISKAKEKAEHILNDSNRLIEKTIREIRESQANKEKTKVIRKDLKKEFENILSVNDIPASKPVANTEKVKIKDLSGSDDFNIGDFVKIQNQDKTGEVVEIKGNEATVVFGSLKVKSSIKNIKKCNPDKHINKTYVAKSSYSGIINELNDKLATFETTIDLRGKRANESLSIIQSYIDEAILLNIPEVRILHGKGSGVLRKIIREYLSTVTEIKQFSDEILELGGHGVTIVKFR